MISRIWFAGGCFWGMQAYLSAIPGVEDTCVGYANGVTESPTYEQVCTSLTGHAETVEVRYDPSAISISDLVFLFFEAINPLQIDGQGSDRGSQYRSGVYYVDPADGKIAHDVADEVQARYQDRIATEILPLTCFYPAEDDHQDYLEKNPSGYCHMSHRAIEQVPTKARLVQQIRDLTPLQYLVTQHEATEPAHHNDFDQCFEPGIYVDVVSGKPLFVSTDKFDSGCGWPAFSRPISPDLIEERTDRRLSRVRTEVRSKDSQSHLGHVFDDGPANRGGLRYCINSAALRFVSLADMEVQGYGDLIQLVTSDQRNP